MAHGDDEDPIRLVLGWYGKLTAKVGTEGADENFLFCNVFKEL
jgi:hypothetical protein